MARRYTRNELLQEFGSVYPKLAAAATAFLDEDCFEENFRQWVAVQGFRGEEANDAMLDHLLNWFDEQSDEECQELNEDESESIF
jgi:hypothetical protein